MDVEIGMDAQTSSAATLSLNSRLSMFSKWVRAISRRRFICTDRDSFIPSARTAASSRGSSQLASTPAG